jgi:hypothetical protein
MKRATRKKVRYRYDAINPEFLLMMAEIGAYADETYEDCFQYSLSELTKDADPLNHVLKHYVEYVTGVPYDHFEGDPRRHLVAIAYNAMMKFLYHTKYGWRKHPLLIDEAHRLVRECAGEPPRHGSPQGVNKLRRRRRRKR